MILVRISLYLYISGIPGNINFYILYIKTSHNYLILIIFESIILGFLAHQVMIDGFYLYT